MAKIKKDQSGFTIAEVSIASTVFAVVLLIALAVFFGISRLFYKGVSTSQTQEAAQQIMQDISGNFHANSVVNYAQTGGGYTYHCVSGVRYTYNLDHEINVDDPLDHSAGGNYGILMDQLPNNGCAAPCSDTGSVVCNFPFVKLGQYSPVVELLGNNMRVSKFDIARSATSYNLYNINLVLAYGDNDVLDRTDPTNPQCKSQRGSEFCAVNRVSTSIYKGQGV